MKDQNDETIECDAADMQGFNVCDAEAMTYCSGCEAWRCNAHDCDCGAEL
jgi:hypothetical protein